MPVVTPSSTSAALPFDAHGKSFGKYIFCDGEKGLKLLRRLSSPSSLPVSVTVHRHVTSLGRVCDATLIELWDVIANSCSFQPIAGATAYAASKALH